MVVVTKSYLNDISGRMGDLVFYAYGGKQYARRYAVPLNPDTCAQRQNRKSFSEAVAAWQNISLCSREQWNRKAKGLCMSGYNLFISRFLLGKSGNPSCDAFSTRLSLLSPRSLSVLTSFSLRKCSITIPAVLRGAELSG